MKAVVDAMVYTLLIAAIVATGWPPRRTTRATWLRVSVALIAVLVGLNFWERNVPFGLLWSTYLVLFAIGFRREVFGPRKPKAVWQQPEHDRLP